MKRSCLFSVAVLLAIAAGCSRSPSQTKIDEIKSHIQAVLELPTIEYIYRDIVFVDREKTFLIFKTMQAQVLFAIDVRIQAGFDLTEGFTLTPKGNREISVSLPAAKILLVDAEEESIRQYFIKEIGGEINRLDYYDEINSKKAELQSDAISRGIKEAASTNAQKLIRNILSLSGFTSITVETAS